MNDNTDPIIDQTFAFVRYESKKPFGAQTASVSIPVLVPADGDTASQAFLEKVDAASKDAQVIALAATGTEFTVDDNGTVTIVPEAETPKPAAAAAPEAAAPAAPAGGAVTCGICGNDTWDNREGKRNPKAPDYKCRDKNCGGAAWMNEGVLSAWKS